MTAHSAPEAPPDQSKVPAAPKGVAKKVRIAHLLEMKQAGRPIVMVTAYDTCFAAIADQAGIDVLLVGDSLGNVVHGFETTIPVTMDMMVLHTQAVVRGAPRALVVADMPFMSYHVSKEEALRNAGRLVQEGGASAVKLEVRSEPILEMAEAIQKVGIPVMGHLGLLPQSVHATSGYRVQGRDQDTASLMKHMARRIEEAGCFSLVFECIPAPLARQISASLRIPTIGIGAGAGCDGQVLVMHDLLGLHHDDKRFVRRYADLRAGTLRAFRKYARDVREKLFPAQENEFD